ncbi:hypothetical protein DL769_008965 [Monosporascus sp. CRB-8-3]|nr:hypothetical protein DL769_008965 [Monosporascus sp. CRB-8-3]
MAVATRYTNAACSGVGKSETISKDWLETMDRYQGELASDIEWEVGHVPNYAAQHARWAWEGERKILASFWDRPSISAQPVPTA